MLYANFDDNMKDAVLMPLSAGDDAELERVLGDKLKTYLDLYRSYKYFSRFSENETYIDGNHWDLVADASKNVPTPHTPVLWSTTENIHADVVEAYPKAATQAMLMKDKEKTRIADLILNGIAFRRQFRGVWTDMGRGVIHQGIGFIETFWDKTLYNGLGDVNYKFHSCRSVIFDPTVADIQLSEAVFVIGFQRKSAVVAEYPQTYGLNGVGESFSVRPTDLSAAQKDSESSDLVLVADAYWRELVVEPVVVVKDDGTTSEVGKKKSYRLQYVRLAGGKLVERHAAPDQTMYMHGEYPLTPYNFLGRDGSLFSLGIVDRFKKIQWYVDKADQAILINLLINARLRLLVARGANIDMEALLDWEREVIEGTDVSEGAVRWMDPKPLTSVPQDYVITKTAQMKDESGSNQFDRGEGGRGITAASAIAMLQEAAGKRSRKLIDHLYQQDYHRQIQTLMLAAEFYTEGRTFTLTDQDGEPDEMTVYGNQLMNEAQTGLFDMFIKIHAERDLGYKTELLNQRAIELANAGILDGQGVFTMMRFDGKEEVMQYLADREQSENAQLKQMVADLQAQLEQAQKGFRPPMKQTG